ncbi:MAG: hypothetical protein Q8S00_06220 [Deltaproteobacteria bacterium]|nr:hypothetical protein [Deltaproteobacteria bacterium]MDZ4341728.1 hypothetical protein [Candidatus Binatia bacterium]
MNSVAVVTEKFRFRGSRVSGKLAIAILSGLLAACAGSEPPRLNSAPSPPLSLAELKQRVSEIRALPFKQTADQAELSALSSAGVGDDLGGPSLAQIARAYKRIGLLAESVDFAKAMMEFARLKRLAVYEAGRERLTIAPEAARLGEALAGTQNGDPNQVASVLALARALQDQHFRWSDRVKGLGSEDRKLAFQALADGDALLVALNYLSKYREPLNWAQATNRFAAGLEKVGGHLPELLKQDLIFPYRDGSQFAQWAFLAKGWSGVNALFAEPPISSAQILHPEKYYLRRFTPLRITPFGLRRQFKENAVLDETLGEFRIQILLGSNQPREESRQIAAGWTGDHLSAYPDGDGLITAWISAWSGDKEARDFQRAFRSVLERRHRVRFDETPGQPDGWKANLRTGRSIVLQTRGAVVLFLDGIASARALEVSEENWKNLEIAPESVDLPFESAKQPAQLSLSSK